MRPLRALAIYLAAIFIGGALLAPWLYWLAQSFSGEFPWLAGNPFHRFVDRSFLGVALMGLRPFLRSVGINSWREAGLARSAGQWKQFGAGFLLGLTSLGLAAGCVLLAGARRLDDNLSPLRLLEKVPGILLASVVVALLEEILFRGTLFGSLRKSLHWGMALVLSSMFYAIVHFLQKADAAGTVTWFSGLELLPRMLGGFADWHAVVPGFFNLTLAGLLLGLAYQRTGNLFGSIGLHAGWVCWLKLYGDLSHPALAANAWWWGTSKMTDGWLALPVLAVTLWFYTRGSAKPKRELPHEHLRAS